MLAQSSMNECDATSTVSQMELERLQELRATHRDYTQLRNCVLDRLENGADVEAGDLGIRIERCCQKRFSRRAVEQVLGIEQTEQLHEHLVPTVMRTLRVYSRNNDDNVVEI